MKTTGKKKTKKRVTNEQWRSKERKIQSFTNNHALYIVRLIPNAATNTQLNQHNEKKNGKEQRNARAKMNMKCETESYQTSYLNLSIEFKKQKKIQMAGGQEEESVGTRKMATTNCQTMGKQTNIMAKPMQQHS